MDLNSRRQHVNRATSGFDHIPATDQTEVTQPLSSFEFTPPEADQSVQEVEGLNIPRGAPSLFEAAGEYQPDVRVEQPSPLHPSEVAHVDNNQPELAKKSLEDKFAQAINNLEALEQVNQPESPAPVEGDTPNPLPDSVEVVATESMSASPHSEHFSVESPAEITSKHGDDDAGLGATFMSERARLKQEQGVG